MNGRRVEIRALTADEWPLWKALRIAALADSPDSFGETLEYAQQRDDASWIEFAAGAGTAERRALIASADGRAAGMGQVRLTRAQQVHAHLYAMWVDPSARGHGAGRALLNAALDWARQSDAVDMTLRVTEGNLPAIALYRATGFRATGVREPIREDSDIMTMQMTMDLGTA